MSIRAKFRVAEVTCRDRGPHAEAQISIKLLPVGPEGSPENAQFYRWTPGGAIELAVVQPETAAQFGLGQEFYVDFTAAQSGESE